ncbi:glycosyltransferase family 4 protein [Salipaludibacillus sp. CUR1]|uniref:glycosyltransferase family 4 protein n=1 Tax=Salipaludibacillus sp. CUR1 TaxID=2820003 RepID=UPI001E612FCE|nr:glycosyltransferase family 4 protein [Salipaludibacillus sp. CUR1]MCE7792516.1 glycosyltransferase family 4 protein [Salipaludibacillus sp. CUR1]
MPKKILLCATVDYHFKAFHLPTMKWFKEQGWEVHVAASGRMALPYTDKKFTIPIQRSPFSLANVNGYKSLRKVIENNDYAMIHCHTPLGGVLARLAARTARKMKGTKVIYTAHGFHFCKGAPYVNWIIYYPIEKYLASLTDSLITINHEDHRLALNHKFKSTSIEHVHGVGVDTTRFQPVGKTEKAERKKSFGYQSNDFLMCYTAEFNKNKNQKLLIKALAAVKDQMSNARLLLAGEGKLLEECRQIAADSGVSDQVDFLGFRNDIDQFLPICDLALSSSYREGLPVNIMEAQACGLPAIVLKNRGHSELVVNGVNGYVIEKDDTLAFAEKMLELYQQEELRNKFSEKTVSHVAKYSLPKVTNELEIIYNRYMNEVEGYEWAIQ